MRRSGRATVRVIGQNNKRADQFPVVQDQCGKKGKKAKRHKRASLRRVLVKAW